MPHQRPCCKAGPCSCLLTCAGEPIACRCQDLRILQAAVMAARTAASSSGERSLGTSPVQGMPPGAPCWPLTTCHARGSATGFSGCSPTFVSPCLPIFSSRLSSPKEPLRRNRGGVSEIEGDDRTAAEPGQMQPARISR